MPKVIRRGMTQAQIAKVLEEAHQGLQPKLPLRTPKDYTAFVGILKDAKQALAAQHQLRAEWDE